MAPKAEPSGQGEINNSLKEVEPSPEEYYAKNTKNKFENDDWKQGLLLRFRRFLDGKNANHDDENDNSATYRLVATTIITFVAIYIYRSRIPKRLKQLWPAILAALQRPDYANATEVSMSLLRGAATKGLVQRALVGSSSIVFQESGGRWRRTMLPSMSSSLKSDLVEALTIGGCNDVSALPDSIWSKLAQPTLAALPFVYLAVVYRIFRNLNGGEDITSKVYKGHTTTTFADVAGLDPILGEVRELVTYLADPTSFQNLGAQPPRGVLLYGPPGSGKTLLARAVAGEADCDTFVACSGSDFCEMYVGRGAARVRSLFDKARHDARQRRRKRHPSTISSLLFGRRQSAKRRQPATAIIFIDELDALAKSRSYGGLTSNDERDQTLNQLLTEMDGFPTQERDVAIIVIGASNRADVLDPAILRRFDRQIHVGYPNATGREDILKVHARRIQCDTSQVDWGQLASDEMTGNFSGADLRNVVNDAALLAVREHSQSVEHSHLLHAIQRSQAMKFQITSSGNSLNSRFLYSH